MEKEYLQRMQDFVIKAGKFALEKQGSLKNMSLKEDNSLITETDLAVSTMMQEEFSDLFKTDKHILIDEESVTTLGDIPKNAFKHEYLWVLDPIDGTAPYGAGLPFFGVSLGLIKNKQLYMGAIYLPYFDELYICDSEKSYLIKNNQKTELITKPKPLSPTDIFVFNPKLFNFKGATYTGYTNTSVIGLSFLAADRYKGQCNFDSFWDVAAGWAICKQANLSLFNQKTGEEVLEIEQLFDNNWQLKEPIICCHKTHASAFLSALEVQ